MNFVKKKGRISRTDLVIECNRLIKMNPSEEVKTSQYGFINEKLGQG